MHKEGHFGLGLLASSLIAFLALLLGRPIWAVLIGLAGIAGGLLPDIDNKPVVPFRHHGWTHTVVFALLSGIFVAGGVLIGFYAVVQIAVEMPIDFQSPSLIEYGGLGVLLYLGGVVGTFSHLFGDALSTAGGTLLIRPWKPISDNHVRFGVTTAGNPVYNHTFFAVGILSYVALFVMYQ